VRGVGKGDDADGVIGRVSKDERAVAEAAYAARPVHPTHVGGTICSAPLAHLGAREGGQRHELRVHYSNAVVERVGDDDGALGRETDAVARRQAGAVERTVAMFVLACSTR
jgi:hypothetical protein